MGETAALQAEVSGESWDARFTREWARGWRHWYAALMLEANRHAGPLGCTEVRAGHYRDALWGMGEADRCEVARYYLEGLLTEGGDGYGIVTDDYLDSDHVWCCEECGEQVGLSLTDALRERHGLVCEGCHGGNQTDHGYFERTHAPGEV